MRVSSRDGDQDLTGGFVPPVIVGEPNAHSLIIAYLVDIPFTYHSYTLNIFTARDLLAFQADWINRMPGSI